MKTQKTYLILIAALTLITSISTFAQEEASESEPVVEKKHIGLITCNGVHYNSDKEIFKSLNSDMRDFVANLPALQGIINDLKIGDVKATLTHPLDELAQILNTIQTEIEVLDLDSFSSNIVHFQSLQANLSDYVSAVDAIEKSNQSEDTEQKKIVLPESVLTMKTRFSECTCKLTYLIRVANEGY